MSKFGTHPDPWLHLKDITDARIALGRAGTSLPTAAHLSFQLDHALARDAVHTAFAPDDIAAELYAGGLQTVRVQSQAETREIYLQRPDLGRRLDEQSAQSLTRIGCNVALVIGDGLSALAAHQHAAKIALRLHQAFTDRDLSVAPIVLARGARVALADEIGDSLNARVIIILLGERPGLSSADSLGAYLTFSPQPGRHDAQRNCVSNIRPDGGLNYAQASHKLIYLTLQALHLQCSGVALKDDSDGVALLS
jgi:ethanolamine ammonia-lyase small subunit